METLVKLAVKIVNLIVLCFLAGCANSVSLEDLEAEAMVSGDWSAVDKREQSLRRRRNIGGPECPDGLTLYCVDDGMGEHCQCVTKGAGIPIRP